MDIVSLLLFRAFVAKLNRPDHVAGPLYLYPHYFEVWLVSRKAVPQPLGGIHPQELKSFVQ